MSYNQNTQQNFLNKYSKVSPNSSEWNRIEYLLQLCLGSTSAVISNIWSIANPIMTQQFEKRTKNLLVLDSWLETSQMNENTRIEKVCSKGFDFSQRGLSFVNGHLKLSDNQMGRNKVYEVLLLKTAVGKSYCLPGKTVIKDKYKLPYGFDSIYFYQEDDDEGQGIFRHEYMLFDNSQVLPMYIVHFEFDQSKEDALTQPICDVCQENNANIYCQADDAVLCYECDEEHHLKGGKLVSRHQRVPISEKPKSFGMCPSHQDAKLELYCTYCHIPLCVYCKINGTHSGGEAAGHPLVKITDAYKKALSDSKEFDPLLEKRKNQLAELLSQVDQRIKDINKNASVLEEKIYKILQNALIQLQEETQKKMSMLIGDQLELKRQYDNIQWLESFLKYQQNILNPADYLNSWARHSNFRNEILQLQSLPILTNVQPDMRIIENKITVTTDSIHKHYEDDVIMPDKQLLDKSNYQHEQQEQNMGLIQNIFGKHSQVDKNQTLLKQTINNQTSSQKSQSIRSEYTDNNSVQQVQQINLMSYNRSPTKQRIQNTIQESEEDQQDD